MTVVESAKMTQEWWLFVTNLIENYNLQLPSGNFSENMVKGKINLCYDRCPSTLHVHKSFPQI